MPRADPLAVAPWVATTRRERLTLIRIFEELPGRGYLGGYDAVRRYARGRQRDRAASLAGADVPHSFAPGEAYQFDWSHEIVLVNGTTVTVKVAHVRLCHRRMLYARAYPRETQSPTRIRNPRPDPSQAHQCSRWRSLAVRATPK